MKVWPVSIVTFRISLVMLLHLDLTFKQKNNFSDLVIFSDFSMLHISLRPIESIWQQQYLWPCLNIDWRKCTLSRLSFNIKHIICINCWISQLCVTQQLFQFSHYYQQHNLHCYILFLIEACLGFWQKVKQKFRYTLRIKSFFALKYLLFKKTYFIIKIHSPETYGS